MILPVSFHGSRRSRSRRSPSSSVVWVEVVVVLSRPLGHAPRGIRLERTPCRACNDQGDITKS